MKQAGKTGPKKLRLPLVFFFALILASCASTGAGNTKKQGESLKSSVEAFNNAFRWEDYRQATIFVPPDKREVFWNEVDKFKGKIRLWEFELRDIELKGSLASAIVRVQFWRPESPTLESVNFTQRWYYTEKDKQWKVSDTGYGAITRNVKSY